jgi:hypothetical protein
MILDNTKTENRETKDEFVKFMKKWADDYLALGHDVPTWYTVFCVALKARIRF